MIEPISQIQGRRRRRKTNAKVLFFVLAAFLGLSASAFFLLIPTQSIAVDTVYEGF